MLMRLTALLVLLAVAVPQFDACAGGKGKKRSDHKEDKDDADIKAGIFDFIASYADELKLTADQKARCPLVKEAYTKIASDSELKECLLKGRDARRKGDTDLFAAMKKTYYDKMLAKSGNIFGSANEAVQKLLTKEQYQKLQELRQKEGEDAPDMESPFGK